MPELNPDQSRLFKSCAFLLSEVRLCLDVQVLHFALSNSQHNLGNILNEGNQTKQILC